MPTCYALKPYQYTVGLHEIAVGQFNRLQVFFSPWQNIGMQRLGLKYQLASDLSLSLGYHWGTTDGTEYNFQQRRLGVNLVKGMVTSPYFDWYGLAGGDMRFNPAFGEDPRVQLGMGIDLKLGPYLALMAEALHSFVIYSDGSPTVMETWGAGALRFRLPWMKGLSFDAGVSYLGDDRNGKQLVSRAQWDALEWYRQVYFDFAYSGIF
jgi:hypothetical protein